MNLPYMRSQSSLTGKLICTFIAWIFVGFMNCFYMSLKATLSPGFIVTKATWKFHTFMIWVLSLNLLVGNQFYASNPCWTIIFATSLVFWYFARKSTNPKIYWIQQEPLEQKQNRPLILQRLTVIINNFSGLLKQLASWGLYIEQD